MLRISKFLFSCSFFAFLCAFSCLFGSTQNAVAQEEVIILDDEQLPWLMEDEAPKSNFNLLRIKFQPAQHKLTEEDIKAISAMTKIVSAEKQRVKIKSYSSEQISDQKSRELAMQRALNLREKLTENGFEIDNADFFIFGNYGNKKNLDYIDIDKY